MGHPLIGSRLDGFGIALQGLEAQEAVMVRRLVLRWDAQPFVIRVERRSHT